MAETTKINDGGPAYPVADLSKTQCWGMSLRDAFAIAALQSLASAMQDELLTTLEDQAHDTARACYTIADAMLRARTQEQQK